MQVILFNAVQTEKNIKFRSSLFKGLWVEDSVLVRILKGETL